MSRRPTWAIVGGGIAGLAAAWDLAALGDVTIVEPGPPGGAIRTGTFAGRTVELGPDAFLTRVPDATALCAELGIDDLVAPSAGRPMLWAGGRLRAMPDGLVLGVPRDLTGVARSGILTPAGVLRAGLDLVLPRQRVSGDLSVHHLVASRFGHQVADRLVDPLIGGIHAGRTEALSAAATAPQLLAAARQSRSLLLALRAQAAAANPAGGSAPTASPVFLTPRAGLGHLVERLLQGIVQRGGHRVEAAASAIRPLPDGRVAVEPDLGVFDGVVLATPAHVAAALLGPAAPDGLDQIQVASVALTLLSYAGQLDVPSDSNGFLVPRRTGRLMTACSFASAKWPHWSAPARTLLRVSTGRDGDTRAERLDDPRLVEELSAEVGAALGTTEVPTEARVIRWPGSFPQYRVGHLERVADIEADLRRTRAAVVLAGASYRGSGIPACIRSGRTAAGELLAVSGPSSRD